MYGRILYPPAKSPHNYPSQSVGADSISARRSPILTSDLLSLYLASKMHTQQLQVAFNFSGGYGIRPYTTNAQFPILHDLMMHSPYDYGCNFKKARRQGHSPACVLLARAFLQRRITIKYYRGAISAAIAALAAAAGWPAPT